jgi:hypothetical protein
VIDMLGGGNTDGRDKASAPKAPAPGPSGLNAAEARRAEDRAIRRLLEAAASDPGKPHVPSPFLLSRVRAAIAEAPAPRPHPFGLAAIRMLPALALLVAVLSGWAGWETREAQRYRSQAMASLISPDSAGGDLVLAALFLGGGAE